VAERNTLRRRRSLHTRVVGIVGALGFAAVLVACDSATAVVTVAPDRSATVVVEVAPRKDLVRGLTDRVDFDEVAREVDRQVTRFDVQRVSADGRDAIRMSATLDDVSELGGDFAAQTAAGPVRLFERFDVAELDDGWALDAQTVAPSSILAGVRIPGFTFDRDVTAMVRVVLPGRVVTTNATETTDAGPAWRVDLNSPVPVRMTERTGPGQPVNRWWLLAAGGLAAVVVGAFLVLRSSDADSGRRIRRSKESPRPEASWSPTSDELPPVVPVGGTANLEPGMYDLPEGVAHTASIPVGGRAWGAQPEGSSISRDSGAAMLAAARDRPSTSRDGASTALDVETASSELPETSSATSSATRIGSSPAGPRERAARPPSAAPQPPPGWYPDPEDPATSRFWNGADWTEHTR
jgi:hypothetical protein